MKNIVKKNQIIITALSIMIAVAGYLNFSGRELTIPDDGLEVSNTSVKEEEQTKQDTNESEPGTEEQTEETLVDTMDISDADEVSSVASNEGAIGNQDDAQVSAPVQDSIESDISDTKVGEAVLTEAQVSDFITKAK